MTSQSWLFAHDTRFFRRKTGVYTADAFPAEIWSRYLAHAGHVTVLAREGDEGSKAVSSNVLSSATGVDFELCPNISGLKRRIVNARKAEKLTRDAVATVDGVVARLPSEYGLLAVAEARRTGKPWLLEMTGCPLNNLWNYGTWQGKVYAPIMAARERRVAARAPFAIYVTRRILQSRYPNHGGRQTSCSDVVIDEPDAKVLERRLHRIEQKRSPLRLGLIGTLRTRYKGIQTVFSALSKIRHRLPPVRFHVLGAGDVAPWREEAEACGVADLVSFDAPRSPGIEVMAWLDDIDIYLQPSFTEGLPRATVEAMSRGCPAIGSTAGGIPELLADDCLIKPGNDRQLAELIEKASHDVDWQKKQAKANWREAHEYVEGLLNARRNEMFDAFARAVSASRSTA